MLVKDTKGEIILVLFLDFFFERHVTSLSDLLMVLVTTVWLLISHMFSELLHCWNLNNVLVCLDDLSDKVLTIFQYNQKTIKIKNALRVQVLEHAIIFHMVQGY